MKVSILIFVGLLSLTPDFDLAKAPKPEPQPIVTSQEQYARGCGGGGRRGIFRRGRRGGGGCGSGGCG